MFENRTQPEGEGTREVIPPHTPFQSFACGSPPFKSPKIAFPSGFLPPPLLGLQFIIFSRETRGMGRGRDAGRRDREGDTGRKGADSS